MDDRQGPVMRLLEVTWGWIPDKYMLEHQYSRKLFVQEWTRKGKVVDNLFSSLGIDKAEWLEYIRKNFLGVAGEGIDESTLKKASIVKLNFRCIGPLVK